jgi:hypothetical protein
LVFEDIKINVRFKLFALWSSVMFCYFYGDYFELYQPGKLQEMLIVWFAWTWPKQPAR